MLVLAGCEVKRPGTIETSVAKVVKQKFTVGNKAGKNPLPTTEENIHAGKVNFSRYCMVCHGLDGQKTGVPFADHMYPPVPSLSSAEVQGYTDGQLKWIIEHGIGPSGMPSSEGILKDDEMWTIVQFIRHLPAKRVLDEPGVNTGEQNK
jgi:mono/diheme cytochrome c family protein